VAAHCLLMFHQARQHGWIPPQLADLWCSQQRGETRRHQPHTRTRRCTLPDDALHILTKFQ
jgi:hypothetical protein